jgi:hypothetical protein
MSGVLQNIDPHPLRTPPPLVRGEGTLVCWRGGWGVNILEDARHSSVLNICEYFVMEIHRFFRYCNFTATLEKKSIIIIIIINNLFAKIIIHNIFRMLFKSFFTYKYI